MIHTVYDVQRGEPATEAIDYEYAQRLYALKVELGSGPAIFAPFTEPKRVKNLGWLLRHAADVTTLYHVGNVLIARLRAHGRERYSADFYVCHFESASVMGRWMLRPSLKHARIVNVSWDLDSEETQ